MSSAYILVVEDDANIRAGLVDTLKSEGYRALPAANGEQALAIFQQDKFDLVLLDVMMPKKSGYDVCKAIRAIDERIPVIMLTAKSEEIDKVVGLQLGADDYITKPFGVHELLARIAAVLRRIRHNEKPGTRAGGKIQARFMIGPAEIDVHRYQAMLGRKTFELTVREVQLLQYFHAHPDEVLSRDQLLNAVWGINYLGTTRTLDQHIAQLRKKIEPHPDQPKCIITVHGVGYRYNSIKYG
jgi:DNA-binding response OmpR family regulator